MRQLLLLALIFVSFMLHAQTDKNYYQFATIKGTDFVKMSKAYGKVQKNRVFVDFGTATEGLCYQPLKDSLGLELKFATKTDAMNYLSQLGWEFVEAVTMVSGLVLDGNGSTTNQVEWIVRRSCVVDK